MRTPISYFSAREGVDWKTNATKLIKTAHCAIPATCHALNLTIIKAMSRCRETFFWPHFFLFRDETENERFECHQMRSGAEREAKKCHILLIITFYFRAALETMQWLIQLYAVTIHEQSLCCEFFLLSPNSKHLKFTAFVTQTSFQSLSFEFQRFFFHNHKAPDASSCYPFHAKIL